MAQNDKTSHGRFSLNCLSTVESAEPTPEWAGLIQCKSRGSFTAVMLFNSYTSVSRLINTEPSELLRLRLSEPIASESVEQEFYTPHQPLVQWFWHCLYLSGASMCTTLHFHHEGSNGETITPTTSREKMQLVPGRDINHEGPLRMYKWEDFWVNVIKRAIKTVTSTNVWK